MTITLTGRATVSGGGATAGDFSEGALGPDTTIAVPRERVITVQSYAPGIDVAVIPVVVTEEANIGVPDSSASNTPTSGYTQKTWSGVAIGTAAADRIVVVALGTRDSEGDGGVTPVIATIGGVSATVIEAENGSKALSVIAWAVVPTGTTADVVIAFPGFVYEAGTFGTVYSVTEADTSAPEDSATDNGSSSPRTVSLSVTDGAGVIATAYMEDLEGSSPTTTWTGLTEDYDATDGFHNGSQASDVMTADDATYDVQAAHSITTTDDRSLAAISFASATPGSSTPSSGPIPVNTVEETLLERTDISNMFQYRTTSSHPGEDSWTSGLDDGRISLIEDPDDASVATMRMRFNEGTRGVTQWLVDLLGDWADVTLTFYARFESVDGSAVDFQRGGKLVAGLGGGTVPTGGDPWDNGAGFTTRYNWVEESLSSPDTHVSIYLYDGGYASGSNRHWRLSTVDPTRTRSDTTAGTDNYDLSGDTWFKLEQRIEINSASGVTDARYRAWIDDVLACDVTDGELIGSNSASGQGIDCVVFSAFFGGSDTTEYQAAKDTYLYAKEISWTINDTGEVFTIDLEAPIPTTRPAISGSFIDGQTLTMSEGTWSGTGTISYAYQWRRDGAPITGETNSTYTLATADVGTVVSCTVTATDDEGSRYSHDFGAFVASA